MPVHEKIEIEGAHVLVWKVIETEFELLKLVDERLLGKVQTINSPKSRLGTLASRVALSRLIEQLNIQFVSIQKDEFGKPHLVGCDWNMSISHTDGFVAAIVSKKNFVGVDVETKIDKTFLLREKFCNQEELHFVGVNGGNACLVWSAKESIYKGYGRRKLIFNKDMSLLDQKANKLSFYFKPIDTQLPINFMVSKSYVLTFVNLDISHP